MKTSFKHHHHHHRSSGGPSSESFDRPAPHQQSKLSGAMMEDYVAVAESMVIKWDPHASASAENASLFRDDREEALAFLSAVRDLHRGMLFFASGGDAASSSASVVSSHAALVRAQTLMQAAMRRLEKEFYQILAASRDFLDPESVSSRSSSLSSGASEDGEEDEAGGGAGDSSGEVERAAAAAMADLRAIAETMIVVGYGKECVKVYKVLRKSAIDEGLYRLGFERLAPSMIHKLDSGVIETKIRSWLAASRVVVPTLFASERILMDHVFSGFDCVRETVFPEIAGDPAVQFLRFPEAVAKSKRSMEKMTPILDLYEAISELLPDIESVFSFKSTTAVRDQALASLCKLAEAARATFADFEAAHKEHSKSRVPGGGVHLLTRHVMDYIAVLADYEPTLAEILTDLPLQTPSPVPEISVDTSHTASQLSPPVSSLSSNDDRHESAVAVRFACLILVLLGKLDAKAAAYRDASLSYLFLANNLQYIVSKVQACRLRGLLGEDWVARHRAKARQHAVAYARLAWGKVASALLVGEVAPGDARERMQAFSAGLEEACTAQMRWVVADTGMREEVRAEVQGIVLPAYRSFFEQWKAVPDVAAAAKFSPEDVGARLAELFAGSQVDTAPDYSYSSSWSDFSSSRSGGSSRSALR